MPNEQNKNVTPDAKRAFVFKPEGGFYEPIINVIRQRRLEMKMSQRTLSSLSGLPQKTISQIESGIVYPKLSTIFAITEVLGMEIEIALSEKVS